MHIAPLQASDAAPYRTLMLQAYELAADAFTSTAAERVQEPHGFWVDRIASPAGLSVALGAFDGATLVGTVAIEYSVKPKTRHKALVLGMYVAPEARRSGAGGRLLAALIDCARARPGVELLTLTVTEDNAAALQLYRRAGFQAFGTEPMAILTPSGYKGKVHMWLRLQRGGPADAAAADPAGGGGAGPVGPRAAATSPPDPTSAG